MYADHDAVGGDDDVGDAENSCDHGDHGGAEGGDDDGDNAIDDGDADGEDG